MALSVEQRLERLERAVRISDDGGTVVVQALQKVVIKSATIEIEGVATLALKGGAFLEVTAGGTLALKGGGMATVQAGIVRINNGSSPVAHVGSHVIGMPPMVMQVNKGNASVLV